MSIREEVASQLAQLNEAEVMGVSEYLELQYAVQPSERTLGARPTTPSSVGTYREPDPLAWVGQFWGLYLLTMLFGVVLGAGLYGWLGGA